MSGVCDECGVASFEDLHIDDAGQFCFDCVREQQRQGALDAGIPASVVDGKTKLTDHFTRDYIDSQRDPQHAQMLRKAAGDNE